MGEDRDEMQWDRKMDERKEGRGDLVERRPITSGWPCKPDACHSSALLLWHCIMHARSSEWNAVSLVRWTKHRRFCVNEYPYSMIGGHAACSLQKTELHYLHFGARPSSQQFRWLSIKVWNPAVHLPHGVGSNNPPMLIRKRQQLIPNGWMHGGWIGRDGWLDEC